MADGLKPYPEYRSSGLSWAETIPSHWEVRRNARLFAERNETGLPDLPILEVSIRTGVTVRDLQNGQRKQMMTDRAKYKRAVRGDIAYNMMRMWQGAVGAAPVDGLISPAYVVARPLAEVNSRYYSYLFRTRAYMNEVNKFSRGIVTDRNRLYWDEFRQMPSLFPPIEEQTAITDFLDSRAGLIAAFVRTKRRQIELLKEHKHRIVEHLIGEFEAPTIALRGLCEMRLSGVDKHSHDNELPVRLCNYTDVYKRDVITPDIEFMRATATAAEIAGFSLRKNDVLLTKDSEDPMDIAVPAVVAQDLDGVLCGYHLAMLRPNPEKIDGHYLFRCLTAPKINLQFALAAVGVTRYALSKDAIKAARIPVPAIPEQRRVVAEICEKISAVDQKLKALHREIDLAREQFVRLCSEAVTGQIDVRNASIEPMTGMDEGDEPGFDETPGAYEEVAVGDE